MNFKYDKSYLEVIDMIVSRVVIQLYGYVFAVQYTTKRLSVTFDLHKINVHDNNQKIYSKGFFSKGFDAYLDNLVKLRGATHE